MEVKSVIDGYVFKNKMEVERYRMLKQMKERGIIQSFKINPKYTLVRPYNRCPCCGTLSEPKREVCKLCETETYTSNGIQYYATFLVYEKSGRKTLEVVRESLRDFSHEFNMKSILYDQLYSVPIRIVVSNVRYLKTGKGWVEDHTNLCI
jgi:hypothetical protein